MRLLLLVKLREAGISAAACHVTVSGCTGMIPPVLLLLMLRLCWLDSGLEGCAGAAAGAVLWEEVKGLLWVKSGVFDWVLQCISHGRPVLEVPAAAAPVVVSGSQECWAASSVAPAESQHRIATYTLWQQLL